MNSGISAVVHGRMATAKVSLLVAIFVSACGSAKDGPLVGRWDRDAPPNCQVQLYLMTTGQWARYEGCPIDDRNSGWHVTNGTYVVTDAILSMTTLQGSCTCDHRTTEELNFSLVGNDLMLAGEGHDEMLTRTANDAGDFGLSPLYGYWVDDPTSGRIFIPFPIQDLDAPDAG